MTLDQFIEKLQAIRSDIGGDAEVVNDNDDGLWMEESEISVEPGHYSSYEHNIYRLPCGHMMCSEIDLVVIK